MIQKEEVLKVGFFTKPHGIKGELSLVTEYELFEDENDPYLVCEMDGILVPFFVKSFRHKNNTVVLVKLDGIDDEQSAKRFINQEVFYPSNRLKTPEADDPPWKFFTGYLLVDTNYGELGVITEVDNTTINTLLRVDYRGKELLAPMSEEIFSAADFILKKLFVRLPDGILDL
jgi:16S rRNA processing protein RimM